MGDDREREELSPAEFTRRTADSEAAGEETGPDAPDTIEPTQGHQDPDAGPGGPAMQGLGGSGPEGDTTTRAGAPTEENRGSRR